ncbi:MAG TPA: methyltransferase domain-containing protein [Steroidobacteraceae bacterium]|nr:methyltransferase domain-containing protein [Steroidobacteraceae bacterium]
MQADHFAHTERCPVCGGGAAPMLSLLNQAIYQHPVPTDADVRGPFTVDLSWVQCARCTHAWQATFDARLLKDIYRSHYYTPAPAGMGMQFRDVFLRTLDECGLLRAGASLLEIGASDGNVLHEMMLQTGSTTAYAFEPNRENADIARKRGLTVYEAFFGASAIQRVGATVDFVFARHVIEHAFDFEDFFAGVNGVASGQADLVLETPSLDHHARLGSLAPFHIEHLHVFSQRSLTTLAQRFGWHRTHGVVTADGNLIAAFGRDGTKESNDTVPSTELSGLQAAADSVRARLCRATEGRQLIFWGAGSAAVSLVRMLGREPDMWTDGNPNKYGRKFPGLKSEIVSPERALAMVESSPRAKPLLVITSSFVREILPRVRARGWTGEIMDLDGNFL